MSIFTYNRSQPHRTVFYTYLIVNTVSLYPLQEAKVFQRTDCTNDTNGPDETLFVAPMNQMKQLHQPYVTP